MICSLLAFTIETLIYHHHHIKEMTINDKIEKYGIKEMKINDKIDKYGTHQYIYKRKNTYP